MSKVTKKTRSAFEYRDERNRNLLKVFNRELELCDGLNVKEVIDMAVRQPAQRFWVSEERALRVVSAMYHHPLPSGGHPLKREMFEEIKRRCERLQEYHPEWSLRRRVYYVVNREAPRFYLSVAAAHVIICQEKKKCKQEIMQRLRRWVSAAS